MAIPDIGGTINILPFLQRKFPYTSTENYDYKRDPKRKTKFIRWFYISLFIAILYVLGFPILYTAIISKIISALYIALIPKAATYYPPTWLMYAITGFPLATATLIWLYEWTIKLFLQSDYQEFEDFYNDRLKYDNKKAGVWVAKILLVITVITIPFLFTTKVVVYEDHIVLNKFYEITSKSYKYEQLENITHHDKCTNRAGVIKQCDRYTFCFADGYNFVLGFYNDNNDVMLTMVNDVASKTGKSILNFGTYNRYKK